MLRQVVTGAAAVMTVGLLAVGCGSDGDTIIGSTGGILNNNDQFPASSIFTNNVWVDGGGFSPNDADLTGYRVIWSCDAADSDGEFQGDNSAIVLFQVQTQTTPARTEQYVSHYNGQNFTQPEQMIGVDQDETVAPGPLNSVVALQLNTSDYTTSVQADQARVRMNDDNWLVVWSATTFTNNPQNAITQVQTSSVGPHRTIYYTVFRKESRDTNETTLSDFIGATANPVTLRHGWVLPGIEVVPTGFRSGPASDTVTGLAVATNPSDVQSFGLVSDGFAGQASFGSDALPALGTGALAQATSYTVAVPSVNGNRLGTGVGNTSTFRAASFRGGERTTMVQVFYTQNISSIDSTGPSVSTNVGTQSNGRIAAFNASFNLTTLQWETPSEFRPVAARNANNSTTTSPGTGFYPTFHTYNNQVFYKYLDASLAVGTNLDPLAIDNAGVTYAYDNVGGHEGGIMNSRAFYEDIIGVATFVNDGDGTSSIVTGSILDLAAHTSAAGTHDLTNPTSNGGNTINVAPNREMMNFNATTGSKGGQFIFGADEGLGDTTIFYSSADNTRAGGADSAQNNIVRAGYAAAINPAAGTLVAGSPVVWSAHRGAHHNQFVNTTNTGTEDIKKDPLVAQGTVSSNGGDGNSDISPNAQNDEDSQSISATGRTAWYFDATINRTGEYIVLTYLQDLGTSLGFHRAVNVVTYQPFRTSTGTTGGQTGTQVNVNLRFTAPLEVSQTGSPVSITQPAQSGNSNAEMNSRWDALPANSACIQDKVDYRCAYQSNNRVLHVLWEQSDATEDRLFSRRITFAPTASGTPTQNTLGTIVEYETNNLVAGRLNNNDGLTGFTHRTTFTALDGTFSPIFGGTSGLVASDLGATDSQGANSGSLFLVFAKVTDATSSDGDFGNAEVFLVTNVNDAITNRISIGRAVNEDFSTIPAGNFNTGTFNVSANSTTTVTAAKHSVAAVLCVNAQSITNIAQSSTSQPNALYIYMLAPASGSTNGSGYTGLFTRKVNLETFRGGQGGTTATFSGSIIPSAGLTGPGSTGYSEPARLDHNLHSNVTNVQTAQAGTGAMVDWQQDHHVWGQITTDGENYYVENGGPNPALVDQDSAADAINYSVSVCTDSDCNARNGIIGIEKYDFNGQGTGTGTAGSADLRLMIRANLQI